MANKKNQSAADEAEEIETTIDSYTGEIEPVAEDAAEFIEVIPEETTDRSGSNYLLNEETSMDSYAANADADAVAEQIAHYTEDEDVEEDFAERQKLAVGGRDELIEELDEHNSLSPQITGGDIDASWQTGNQAGEETVGGSVSTPDQDVVEELGEAVGLTYRDDEPLDYNKVLDRDRQRWELNPASARDENALDEENDDLDDEELDDEEDLDELAELDELDEDEEPGDEDLEEDELEEEDLEDEDDDELDSDLEDEEDE